MPDATAWIGAPGHDALAWALGLAAKAARSLAAALLDPGERLAVYYWPGAAVLAAFALSRTASLRGALARTLAIVRHPSSRLDAKLALANVGLATAVGGAVGLSSLQVAVTTVRVLDGIFGIPEAPAWPPVAATVLYTAVLFVVWDASRFLLHLAMHRIPALWALHAVHHSAEVLTPLTLHRIHPFERALYALRDVLVTGILAGAFFHVFRGQVAPVTIAGIHALSFLANAAGANLRHSHVFVSFGALDRWLLSPAAHQLHHARAAGPRAPNLGTWLTVWDRLAGTYVRPRGDAPPPFGLPPGAAGHDPRRLGSVLLAPVAAFVRALVPRRGSRAALAAAGVLVPAHAAANAPTDPRAFEGPTAVAGPAGDDGDPPAERTAPAATPGTDRAKPEAAPPNPGPNDGGDTTVTGPAQGDGATPPAEDEGETAMDAGAGDGDEGGRRRIEVGSMFEGDRRGRVAGSAHVVDERELARNEYDDVHKILAAVPGVYVRGEEGYGLRPNIGLRGANPDRSTKVALMEDGILLAPAPYAAPAAYYFPMPTRMAAVEVAKGPSSIRFGPNTVGGAVNLRTRRIPAFPTVLADVAGGRFGYGKVHAYAGTTVRGFGVLAEVVRLQSEGFKRIDGGGETGFGRNEAMLKVGYQAEDGRGTTHRVELKGAFSNGREHETYLGLARGDFEADPYRRYAASRRDLFTLWRSLAELTYGLSTPQGLSFTARLYRHDMRRRWNKFDGFRDGPDVARILANPQAGENQVFMALLRGEEDTAGPEQALLLGDNDRRFFAQGADLSASWKARFGIVDQALSFGARVHHDGVDRDKTQSAYWMTAGVLVPEGSPAEPKVRNRARALAGAFYLYDVVTLWERWTIAPGLRVEVIDTSFRDVQTGETRDRLDTVVLPGLSTHVFATRWLGLFAGVHRGFSPVTPGQSSTVRPEDSLNYEVGARVTHPSVTAEAVGFVSDYRNLNAACTLSAGCDPGQVGDQFSAGRALVAGVESSLRAAHTFRRGIRLFGGASYTYTHARFSTSFVSGFPQWGTVTAGDALPYVPAHLVSLSAGTGGRRWEVSATGRAQGAMRDVAGQGPIPEGDRIGGFFVLDLAAHVDLHARLRLYGLLQNATATRAVASLRPMGARPIAPLTFIVGVKVRALP